MAGRVDVRGLLGEMSKDDIEGWMAWWHLQSTEQAEEEMEGSLAASVEEGAQRAKSWR